MKRYEILCLLILLGTAVACNQSQTSQRAILPPTATFVPQILSTVNAPPEPFDTPTATSTATATSTPTAAVYVVQPGDTLRNISGRFAISVEALTEANQIANPDVIAAGQTLIIPQDQVETAVPQPTAVPATETPPPTNSPQPEPTTDTEAGGGAPTPTEGELAPTGRLEITHPLAMVVEESGVITVEIIADPELAGIGEHQPHVTGVVRLEASYNDGERAFYEQTVELFPLMSAELNAPAFEVFPSGGDNVRLPRVISTTLPAVWTWDIIATTPGDAQIITINLYKEAENETAVPILTQSISRSIPVSAKSRWRQLVDGLADNVLVLLGAGGPLGLLLGYLTYRATRENEQLKREVASLNKRSTPNKPPRREPAPPSPPDQ